MRRPSSVCTASVLLDAPLGAGRRVPRDWPAPRAAVLDRWQQNQVLRREPDALPPGLEALRVGGSLLTAEMFERGVLLTCERFVCWPPVDLCMPPMQTCTACGHWLLLLLRLLLLPGCWVLGVLLCAARCIACLGEFWRRI